MGIGPDRAETRGGKRLSREVAQKAKKEKSERCSQKDVYDSIFLTERKPRKSKARSVRGAWKLNARTPRGEPQPRGIKPRISQRGEPQPNPEWPADDADARR